MSTRFEKYAEVFTPATPLHVKSFCFGREQEFRDLEKAVNRHGVQPIVVGNRGVGKTSIVKLNIKSHSAKKIWITCNTAMTFSEFGKRVISEIHNVKTSEAEISTESVLNGGAKGTIGVLSFDASTTTKEVRKEQGLALQTITPTLVFNTIVDYKGSLLIIVDEYESIKYNNEDFHSGISFLIKALGDHSDECTSKIIVIGVASSAEALLGKHDSIERNAREIYLRPLRNEDVRDFLHHAEDTLGFKFLQNVKDAIVKNSFGYPYYVHLVGLECLDAMQLRNPSARLVTDADFDHAIKKAVSQAFRSELRKYKSAIYEASEGEKIFIKELANISSSDKIYSNSEYKHHLVSKKLIPANEYDMILNSLRDVKRIIYISRNKNDLRFADPLMLPFLKTLATRNADPT